MAKYDEPISEFDECPNCESDFGYYQRMYVFGWVNDIKDFEGNPSNHGELYDHINYSREAKYYCCAQCNERIAKVEPIKRS